MKKENIQLRALTQTDLEKTLEWHNQEDIRDTYLGHPFPVNREKEEAWYQKILTNDLPVSVFGIETVNNKKLIGIALLKNINLINREAEFGIYIGDKNEKGKGYSTIASQLTLKFGFYSLGLNRIFLKVEIQNTVAIEMYKKIGFVQEGMLRKSVFKNNEFRDLLIFGMLKDEFKESIVSE